MAQAARQKKPGNKPAARQAISRQSFIRKAPNWPLFGLAVLGMLLSAYLTYSAWQGKQVAGCPVGGGCGVVLNSRWATLFGLPTSFWGFLTYAALALTAWNKRADNQWKIAWVISLFGILYSLYLTSVAVISLQATCPYCLTSLTLMTAIFITVTLQRPANLPRFSWTPWLAKTVGSGIAAVLVLHLYYAGVWGDAPKPEDPWIQGLAEHLTVSGAKFYGAYWCPHCNEQKEMFGGSAKRLPYVECSPGGPSAPQAAECNTKNVQSYPTWFVNGERLTGTQSLETLAQASHYTPKESRP
jgi:uncharacterized membrane protein/glutaredoxin